MGTKIDNLYRKTTEVVKEKKDISQKTQWNVENQEVVKELLSVMKDENVLGVTDELGKAIKSEEKQLESRKEENESEISESLDTTDKMLSSLESNLDKLQKMEQKTDLIQNETNILGTKERISKLLEIKKLLGEDGKQEKSSQGEGGEKSHFEMKRKKFLESYKVDMEPKIKLREEERVVSLIRKADKNELTSFVKKAGLSKYADFGNLDIKVAQQMVESIYMTKRDFPFLNMEFIGSLQSRNRVVQSDLRKLYMDAYKKKNPEFSEKQLEPYVNKIIDQLMKSLKPQSNIIAQSISFSKQNDVVSKIAMKVCGITINEEYGKNYDAMQEMKRREVNYGHKPIGCDTVKATIDHEIGHQIDKHLQIFHDRVIIEMFDKFSCLTHNEQADTLSTYAGTNIKEFIAECWSEFCNNDNCRPVAMKVSRRILQVKNANWHGEVGPIIKEKER